MSNLITDATIALGVGLAALQPTSLSVNRGFLFADGTAIAAQATIRERHTDDIVITDHPVEKSAVISDHMYRLPQEVIIECAFSDSPNAPSSINPIISAAAALGGSAVRTVIGVGTTISSLFTGNAVGQSRQVYAKFIAIQQAGGLIQVNTGKRFYPSMLFKSIKVETDIKTENSLLMTIVCREVILVTTQTVIVPLGVNPNAQAMPQATTPVTNVGTQALTTTPKDFVPNVFPLLKPPSLIAPAISTL